jgi:hypothetical protein
MEAKAAAKKAERTAGEAKDAAVAAELATRKTERAFSSSAKKPPRRDAGYSGDEGVKTKRTAQANFTPAKKRAKPKAKNGSFMVGVTHSEKNGYECTRCQILLDEGKDPQIHCQYNHSEWTYPAKP